MPILNRKCTKEYNIPGTDVVIEEGTAVVIPALAMHRYEKFYPSPEEFIPERFTDEGSTGKTFVERPYMPFGEGPRICVGTRMGRMQTKIGLVLMLKEYSYELSPQTASKKLEMSPTAFVLTPKSNIELLVHKR